MNSVVYQELQVVHHDVRVGEIDDGLGAAAGQQAQFIPGVDPDGEGEVVGGFHRRHHRRPDLAPGSQHSDSHGCSVIGGGARSIHSLDLIHSVTRRRSADPDRRLLSQVCSNAHGRIRDLRRLDDAALATAIADSARITAAAEARTSAGIAELVRRRVLDEHPDWACDDWDACAAEVSCVLTASQGRASGLMNDAITLRDKLPNVGARHLAGELSAYAAGVICNRTALVTDAVALAAIDADIAAAASRFGPLSKYKLEKAVDAIVERRDPGAVKLVPGIRCRAATSRSAVPATTRAPPAWPVACRQRMLHCCTRPSVH